MNVTDYPYMSRMREAALSPALTPMEAAMLPAKPPRSMGALSYTRKREDALWRMVASPERPRVYRQKIWVR